MSGDQTFSPAETENWYLKNHIACAKACNSAYLSDLAEAVATRLLNRSLGVLLAHSHCKEKFVIGCKVCRTTSMEREQTLPGVCWALQKLAKGTQLSTNNSDFNSCAFRGQNRFWWENLDQLYIVKKKLSWSKDSWNKNYQCVQCVTEGK